MFVCFVYALSRVHNSYFSHARFVHSLYASNTNLLVAMSLCFFHLLLLSLGTHLVYSFVLPCVPITKGAINARRLLGDFANHAETAPIRTTQWGWM